MLTIEFGVNSILSNPNLNFESIVWVQLFSGRLKITAVAGFLLQLIFPDLQLLRA